MSAFQDLPSALSHLIKSSKFMMQMKKLDIAELIRTGQDHQIRSHVSTGRGEGMITMDQSLAELVRAGRISRETAAAHCFHPAELRSHLNESV